jgi:hypothetical protein
MRRIRPVLPARRHKNGSVGAAGGDAGVGPRKLWPRNHRRSLPRLKPLNQRVAPTLPRPRLQGREAWGRRRPRRAPSRGSRQPQRSRQRKGLCPAGGAGAADRRARQRRYKKRRRPAPRLRPQKPSPTAPRQQLLRRRMQLVRSSLQHRRTTSPRASHAAVAAGGRFARGGRREPRTKGGTGPKLSSR